MRDGCSLGCEARRPVPTIICASPTHVVGRKFLVHDSIMPVRSIMSLRSRKSSAVAIVTIALRVVVFAWSTKKDACPARVLAAQGRPAVHLRGSIYSCNGSTGTVVVGSYPILGRPGMSECIATPVVPEATAMQWLSTRIATPRETREAVCVPAGLQVGPTTAQDALAHVATATR